MLAIFIIRLWFMFWIELPEILMIWAFLLAAALVAAFLFCLNLSFFGFSVYIGAAAGVLILLAYCSALTSFCVKRRKDLPGLVGVQGNKGTWAENLEYVFCVGWTRPGTR